MKAVEARRHSLTGPDKNISASGIELTQRAAKKMRAKYDLYICGPAPRCGQTMRAFGFSVYSIDEGFGTLPGEALTPLMPQVEKMMAEKGLGLLEAMFQVPELEPVLRHTGSQLLEAVKRGARNLPEGGAALAVSHGGSIEPAALIALGQWDLKAIGGPLKECEGIIFYVKDDNVVEAKVIRL